jgi:hypothetical protein
MSTVLLFHHAKGRTTGSHAFADSSLGDCHEEATELLTERTHAFLQRVG